MAKFKLILKDYESGRVFERGEHVRLDRIGEPILDGFILDVCESGVTIMGESREFDIPFDKINTIYPYQKGV